ATAPGPLGCQRGERRTIWRATQRKRKWRRLSPRKVGARRSERARRPKFAGRYPDVYLRCVSSERNSQVRRRRVQKLPTGEAAAAGSNAALSRVLDDGIRLLHSS